MIAMGTLPARFIQLASIIAWALAGGCAKPGPEMFPLGPQSYQELPGGGVERSYDTDGDGQSDAVEILGDDGVIATLRYVDNGQWHMFDRSRLGDAPADDIRHLVIILDSIPYQMVADLWRQGRLRLFAPPSRVVSPFPVMTDMCLAELFDVSPSMGMESAFFDGQRIADPYDIYLRQANAPWFRCADYSLDPIAHVLAYTNAHPWYEHELGRIEYHFARTDDNGFVGYVVGTSALGAAVGRNGHQAALVRLDRFCQAMTRRHQGRIHITLLSDHGHDLLRSRKIDLVEVLRHMGYRVGNRLNGPGDVVIPEFGLVTCAALYTRSPRTLAQDMVGVEGVDLAMYCDGDAVVVLSRGEQARIVERDGRLKYAPETGDPLHLGAIVESLTADGHADPSGFIDSRTWFDATHDHEYPDAVARLWRAFHGLIEHTPDVMLSIEDGWYAGVGNMADWIDMRAAHGSLGTKSSCGFCMTTAGTLPPVLRVADLGSLLRSFGAPLDCGDANANPPRDAHRQPPRPGAQQ